MMLIFIFQSIWLFIDDLAGRGLDMLIIGKFFFYKMPELTEKVLPLTVLLSSILTFGTFAENYEFAAMKASGISLQRSMLSIIIFIFVLGVGTFWFANSVIPASEQKIFNLRRNIAKLKPAVAIAEGVFSDFESADMNIKVDNKYGENDRFLENVIIHQKTKTNINYRVVKSNTGELISGEKSDIIQLVLQDGHLYENVRAKGGTKRKQPFAKGIFETYTMNIDLSEFNNVDLEEERDTRTEKMKNVSRLRKDTDSLKKDNLRIVRAFSKNVLATKMGAFTVLPSDSTSVKSNNTEKDSLYQLEHPIKKVTAKSGGEVVENIVDLYPEWQQVQLTNSAKNSVSNILTSIRGKRNELDKRYEIHRRHIYATHEKFALAFSCIILFFVGAPLGAIIRKGGLGLPMVIAIVLFLVYYFLGVFAENYAYKGNMHPILGAWTPTLIMLPLGISLTKRATADKGLMAFSRIIDFFKGLFARFKKEDETDADPSPDETIFPVDSADFKLLQANSDDNLIDIAKRYKQYDMDLKSRDTALHILESRGISTFELKIHGQLDNSKFEETDLAMKSFVRNSNTALVLYLSSILLVVAGFFLTKESILGVLSIVSRIGGLAALVFIVLAADSYKKVRKMIGKNDSNLIYAFFLLGVPAFFIIYLFTRSKLKKEIKSIR